MTEALTYPVTALALAALSATLARPTPFLQASRSGSIVVALAHTSARRRSFRLSSSPSRCSAGSSAAGSRPGARPGCSPPPRLRDAPAGFALAGRWSDVFGAYAAAAGGYELRAVLVDVFWHLGAVRGRCGYPPRALALMFRECVQGRETDPAARSLVAIATAWTIAVVVEVGTFASRWVDHVAERDLLTVAPPLFLVFGLWLRRGLPRAGPGARLAALAVAAPAVLLPVARLRCRRLPSMRSASSPPTARRTDVDRDVGAPLPSPPPGSCRAILVPRRARAALPHSSRACSSASRSSRRARSTVSPGSSAPGSSTAVIRGGSTPRGPARDLPARERIPAGAWKHVFWNSRIGSVAARPARPRSIRSSRRRSRRARTAALVQPAGASTATSSPPRPSSRSPASAWPGRRARPT